MPHMAYLMSVEYQEPRVEDCLSRVILVTSNEGMLNLMMTCGLDMKLGFLFHDSVWLWARPVRLLV